MEKDVLEEVLGLMQSLLRQVAASLGQIAECARECIRLSRGTAGGPSSRGRGSI